MTEPLPTNGSLCAGRQHARKCGGQVTVVGVMGHLPHADIPGDSANAFSRARFAKGVRIAGDAGLRPQNCHLAATAATLTDPQSHHTMVRPGAGLVGIDTSGTTQLRIAMTLTAPVAETRRVPAFTRVGHGDSWSTDQATNLALLPLGYADGVASNAAGRAEVLLGGRRRPIVGRVSMDQIVVDTGSEQVAQGTAAIVFGPGTDGEPTPDEWAKWTGSVPRAIVACVGPRVIRTFRGGDRGIVT